ncbi:MAG: FliM/FliN family flagellar motor switch protein [Hungatella sp.]
MADVLSQNQIDMLLNSLQGGSTQETEPAQQAEKSYRKYDFYSPKKFTKDKLRILSDVFDKYSRIMATQLGSILRLTCESDVVAIEEQRYYEFSNALGDDDVMTVVNVELPDQAKNKPVLMHISPMLMVNFIDRMLGGEESSMEIDNSYVYTDIEEALYESIIKYFIDGLRETWATYITLNFNFGQLELSPGMFQAIGMDETIVIITVNLKMDKIQGVLSICFPGNLLSDIFSILDKRINREKEDGMNYVDSSKDIMHYIQGSELSVRARLGNIRLNLVDIYNLHEGDIINLNKPKDSEVEIQVEGTSWFKGRLGQHKKNMSVLITDVNARVKAKQESMET